jgi:hypothetical protein
VRARALARRAPWSTFPPGTAGKGTGTHTGTHTGTKTLCVEVTASSSGSDKSRALRALVAAYRVHRKTKSQLGGRQTFALVVTGETADADGLATAAHFLDQILETPTEDPCQALRAMSKEVAP